jgi:hypothetical protein
MMGGVGLNPPISDSNEKMLEDHAVANMNINKNGW